MENEHSSSDLRILMLSRSLGEGGVPQVIYNLSKGMKSSVDEVRVCYFDSPDEMALALRQEGIPVMKLSGPRTLPRLWSAVSEYQPHVIHTHMMVADVIGRLMGRTRGIPVVSTVHTMYDHRPLTARVPDLLTSAFASLHVGVSQSAIDSLPRYFRGPRTVIHNCIDTSRVSERAAVPWEDLSWTDGLDRSQPLIANVSRYGPTKRREDLVRALPAVLDEHPDTTLIMTGWGEGRERIEALAENIGVAHAIRSVGKLENPYPVYYHADVSVLCSEAETFGVSLLEAGAIGTPIVATDIPAFREVLGESYPLVPPRDPTALGAAINDRLNHDRNAAHLASTTYKRAEERFSGDTAAKSYLRVYRSLLN